MATPVILASASPRRKSLLAHIVDDFSVLSADVDESVFENEKPADLVERLAKSKAQVIAQQYPSSIVLGSDTVVSCEQCILGKPQNFEDFCVMMRLLSNNWHQVYTGVCLSLANRCEIKVVVTDVKMSHISEQDMLCYWQTQEPFDKAGGYAIQGIGGQFVERINGSFSAVVGLPLFETKQLLARIRQQ